MKGRSEFARSGREEQRHDLDLFLDDNWRMRKNRCRSTCKGTGYRGANRERNYVGRVHALQSHNFARRSLGSDSPSNPAQPGGSGLEKEGRWFRLEALNMSDLILSRRTLPPSLPHALYFAIRTNISSPAAPRDLGAERLINACYDERARHHHDSPTATALDEAGWP